MILYPAIITISGFLSEGQLNHENWNESITKTYPNNIWYHLEWSAQRLPFVSSEITSKEASDYQRALIRHSTKTVIFLNIFATVISMTTFYFRLPLLFLKPSLQLSPHIIVSNPWYRALTNCDTAGLFLAQIVKEYDKDVILVGHSLGARIIFKCLRGISKTKVSLKINECHLLGGAVSINKSNWENLVQNEGVKIFNYYSKNDDVLRILYRAGTLLDSAAGLNPIGVPNIKDIDVSCKVKKHTEHIPKFHTFFHND